MENGVHAPWGRLQYHGRKRPHSLMTVQVKEALETLEKGFMVKDRGIWGSRPDELTTVRILNRTKSLRWVVAQNGQNEVIKYE
eukprot:774672-Amphidinium_carterae.1